MSYKTKHENLVINNASGNYCDTITHKPTDAHSANYGQIFITAEIIDDPECSADLTSLIMDEIVANYYNDLSRDSFESFETTLHEVNAALGKYSQSDASWIAKSNISIGVLSGNTLHITTTGTAIVYLLRQGQLIDISENLSDPHNTLPSKTFFNISSGELIEGDTVIFANNKITTHLTTEKFIHACENNSIDDLPSYLAKTLDIKPGDNLAYLFTSLGPETEDPQPSFIPKTADQTADGEVSEFSESRETHRFDFLAKLAGFKKFTDKQWILDMKEKALLKKEGSAQQSIKSIRDKILPKSEKATSLLIVSLICVLVLFIAFNFVRRDSSTQAIELRSLYNEINGRIDDADLKSLYDKPAAIELLERQKVRLQELQAKGFSTAKINESLTEVDSISDKIFNTTRFDDPQSQAALPTKALGMVALDNKIFAYDKKKIYPISDDIVDVKEIIAADDPDEIVIATALNNETAILFITSSGKMLSFKEGAVTEIASANDGWPTGAKGFTEYADTSKIYILDPTANEIWYHAITGTNASKRQSRNALGLNLSSAISFSIDGAIYVLQADGTITKTYGKEQQDFTLSGLPDGIGTASQIFTSALHNRAYLLYGQTNSIVYTAKDGRYIGQYKLDTNNESIASFYPDEANKYLYILSTDNNIYRLKTF